MRKPARSAGRRPPRAPVRRERSPAPADREERADQRRRQERQRRADDQPKGDADSATARNSISASSTTAPPVAPSDFSVARVGRLRSTKPCAALATPTPPTISEIRPISARNSLKRSRFLEKSARHWRGRAPPSRLPERPSSRRRATPSTAASLGGRPAASISTRVVQRTSEPGWTRPVARSASSEINARGPRPMPEPSRSGSETIVARISRCNAPSANDRRS